MTLTQAIKTLEILLNQQMSDTVEEAIRTVLDGIKQRVEVVRCHDCKHDLTDMCMMVDDGAVPRVNDYCSYGVRK